MFRRACVVTAAAIVAIVCASPARASVPVLRPPVYGAIERGFEAPAGPYGPGHRGIDLTAAPGTQVAAAADGTITFAGRVGSDVAVTISHADGLETTYSSLATVEVSVGDRVASGTWIGTTNESHPGAGEGLHFGVKLEGRYVDPQVYLAAADVSDALHLAPLVWQPPQGAAPSAFWDPLRGAGSYSSDAPDCTAVEDPGPHPPAPDDNIAVEVAGIGSHTTGKASAAMFAHGAEALGYPPQRILRYSYRGARGVFLHEPYSVSDTFEDLDSAARRLRHLLVRVERLYPGRDVDLFAHSQGGIVARTYLTRYAGAQRTPRVEHIVTFSSPHTGAPFASNSSSMHDSLFGRALLGAVGLSRHLGLGIPDPASDAVRDLAPRSDLMESLAHQDVVYGTRVLALAMPDDPIVPADRALWPGRYGRVVPPAASVNPHNAILSSGTARAIAYGFLRDAPPSCATSWDDFGPDLGAGIGGVEGHLSSALRVLQGFFGLGV